MKNETLDVINSRRSIRAYKSDAIPRELLDAVLEAGEQAHLQEWADSLR